MGRGLKLRTKRLKRPRRRCKIAVLPPTPWDPGARLKALGEVQGSGGFIKLYALEWCSLLSSNDIRRVVIRPQKLRLDAV